jgi:uncharacterized membrane protein (UPF0182 family)
VGATRDSVAFGVTLGDAVGVRPDVAEVPPAVTPADFRQRVNDLYAAMRDALRRGDWNAFGKAYDELGRLLRVPDAK